MHKLFKNSMNSEKALKSLEKMTNIVRIFLPSDLALISMKAYANTQTTDREEYFRPNHFWTRINSIILKLIVQFMDYLALFHLFFLYDPWILPIFLLLIVLPEGDPGKRKNKRERNLNENMAICGALSHLGKNV